VYVCVFVSVCVCVVCVCVCVCVCDGMCSEVLAATAGVLLLCGCSALHGRSVWLQVCLCFVGAVHCTICAQSSLGASTLQFHLAAHRLHALPLKCIHFVVLVSSAQTTCTTS